MKYVTILIIFWFGDVKSQTKCPKNMDLKKYVEYVGNIDVGSMNLLFIMKIKDNNNKTKRYLISSRDFADLIKINYFLDTSFPNVIKKAILGEDLNINFDSKINDYLIPENMYKKFQKKTPYSIYKKYFNKDGFQKGNPIYFYDWGDYPAILSFLIDNYAIIIIKNELGIKVWQQPCNCKSPKKE